MIRIKTILIGILIIQINFIIAQDFNHSIKLTDLDKYTPKGYEILDTTTGYINNDNLIDLIIIYKIDDSNDTVSGITDTAKRPLLIYFGKDIDNFTLVAYNENVVWSYDYGGGWGDPYKDVSIEKGLFTIMHYGGSSTRWEEDITFNYSAKDSELYLFKVFYESSSIINLDEEGTEKIKTVKDFGVIPFEKFNIYTFEMN